MRIVLLLAFLAGLLVAGCGDPCERLADRICADLRDERACDRTLRDMEEFTPEICSAALKIYDDVRPRR